MNDRKTLYTRNIYGKKHKKTLEEKTAVAKQKKQQRRARQKKETRDNLAKEEILQDDRFSLLPVIPPEVHRMVSPGRKWAETLG